MSILSRVKDIFEKFTHTPEGRARLANSIIGPAKTALRCLTDPVMLQEHPEVLKYARIRIRDMEWVQSKMTGEETGYNKEEFDSLLSQIKEAIETARETPVSP